MGAKEAPAFRDRPASEFGTNMLLKENKFQYKPRPTASKKGAKSKAPICSVNALHLHFLTIDTVLQRQVALF